MTYKKTENLSDESFKNPGPEFRGAPFWAWNTAMTKENVKFMTQVFKDMGMGGAHLHARIGLDTEYLSDEFMDMVKTARESFEDKGMLTRLYDEDRWPSGFCGGYVTKDHKFRERFLVFSSESPEEEKVVFRSYSSSAKAVRSDEKKLLAKYEIELKNGYLASYRMLKEGENAKPGAFVKYAFLEVSGDNPWFNNQAYVNTFDKKAIDEFIKLTHEKYYAELGDRFGKDIPSIFTDEPQFPVKERLGFAEDDRTVIIPFSDDFEEDFSRKYGHSLLESLPELFWELGENRYSVTRYEYHDFVSERFASAFADNIGDWCKKHGILLTGHMMDEPTLNSQTAALGEAMRSYRGFDIPGIDMLCDKREFTTAKQAASAAHQLGAPGVMSELYGVTGYNFDFRGHKLQGDWQAALGITLRVPHLSWTSMAGEAKRDYPASICYQSPWYREYKYVEDYFGRLNTALTRGTPEVKVGVIHPVESFWLLWGNEAQTGDIRKQRDEEFSNIVNWLLLGLVDFDFISESLLAGFENGVEDGRFKCGSMKYDVIVVPNLITLRSTTLKLLKAFSEAGGKVIFAGNAPTHVDARPTEEAKKLAANCTQVPFDRFSILRALEDYRTLDVRNEKGLRTENLIYQRRKEDKCDWLFICHAFRAEPVDIPRLEKMFITIKGTYKPVLYDALSGEISEVPYKIEDGNTLIYREAFAQDSLLFKLEPVTDATPVNAVNLEYKSYDANEGEIIHVPASVKVDLEEDNVLLLDMAEISVDGGEFEPLDEILRIDNDLRVRFGGSKRMHAWPQPWAMRNAPAGPTHDLILRYTFDSEIEGRKVSLGLEKAKDCVIEFNGEAVSVNVDGYYVDRDIDRIALGVLKKGKNVILVKTKFNTLRDLEAMYLLGDFGVRLKGFESVITEKPTELNFGNIAVQDLSFYSANVDYIFDVDVPADGTLKISATDFRCPLIAVELDGERVGTIAFAPYEVRVNGIKKGTHRIKMIAFGNRNNTFGPLHMCDRFKRSQSPDSWRTEGSEWSYEYVTDPAGILKRPEIRFIAD